VKRLLVIVGPTAVGKTAVAVSIAEKFHTEIISADSRQFFRELNVGTAKPSTQELSRATHHFINSKSIHDTYDAGQFGREALDLIHKLFKKYDTAVMVGGSGLYIQAVLEGFDDLPRINNGIRKKIQLAYETNGIEWLQEEVKKTDPDFFLSVDQKNPQRLMRALELLQTTGRPMKELRVKKKSAHPFSIVKVGLNIARERLYERIDSRMDAMITSGLFEEARQLYPFKNTNALQTVGYSEIFDHLDGLHDYSETIRLLKRNSRRYAKRQLTWFLRDKEITWFDSAAELIAWVSERIK